MSEARYREALNQALRNQYAQAREKLVSLGSEMYTRGLDKSDEIEADRYGVVIAARGGYDAYGLPAVLQTLQAMNAQDSALALMFKTHPAPGERLAALGDTMQPTLDAYAKQPQLADRFLAARLPARPLADEPDRVFLKRDARGQAGRRVGPGQGQLGERRLVELAQPLVHVALRDPEAAEVVE